MNTLSDKDKIIAVQEELIKNLQNQVAGLEKTVKEWEDWKASSEERHAKGKSNLTNLKNKNTLRFNTTRKPKK